MVRYHIANIRTEIASRENRLVAPQGQLIEMLELYDGKLSCSVLRWESGSNARDLSGIKIYNLRTGSAGYIFANDLSIIDSGSIKYMYVGQNVTDQTGNIVYCFKGE